MRLLFLFFFSFPLFANVLTAQTVSDKLEAYFSFNSCKGVDDSGNGSSGALIGDVECRCGIGDSSFYFNGDDAAIYFVGPFAEVFTTSDFTVSFYMKTPQGQQQGGSQIVMSKQQSCDTKRAFWVRYAAKTRKITSGISESDTLLVTVSADLDKGPCWQHITLTRSNQRYSIYVNGVLKDQKNSTARIDLTNNAVFKVGEPICPLDQPFIGEIDEVRFHSKALNADEVKRYDLKADKILNGDTLIYLGNSFQTITYTPCAKQFLWSPTTGVSDPLSPNPIITPEAPSLYTVTIVHDNNCQAVDSVFVNVIDPDTLDCSRIFIPNAFTPGGSPGRNDAFGISNPFAVRDFISFEVFDRWGGRVFNALTPFDTWDGTFGGKPTNPGVFLYRLRYKCEGEELVRTGNLTLLR
ncbi:MAG: gliding motility-associated C-terminal domain-containing protein [Saprospiraceae bacterium]|nr:gliding motility-associated C-terminal domain-containing protein [Saprospiraceae bacterium]